ncbi:hypothetical protein AX15_007120 [Amanita polypyramis BW_CC]|nr:hypothetical protein AX15_007120 [Amanita polypyramis BW_CC]
MPPWNDSQGNLRFIEPMIRRKKSVMDLGRGELVVDWLSEACCLCPLYRLWKVTSSDACSLKASLEYTGTPEANLQCLMVSPPIMPMIDKGGQVHRAIREVALTVDRTTSVGVVIIRPNNGILPEWARKGASPASPIYQQDGFADMMAKPWLWPPAGEELSTVVDWEGDFGVDYHLGCPAQPGDRLGIVARFGRLDAELSIKFSVMLEVEYGCG